MRKLQVCLALTCLFVASACESDDSTTPDQVTDVMAMIDANTPAVDGMMGGGDVEQRF